MVKDAAAGNVLPYAVIDVQAKQPVREWTSTVTNKALKN